LYGVIQMIVTLYIQHLAALVSILFVPVGGGEDLKETLRNLSQVLIIPAYRTSHDGTESLLGFVRILVELNFDPTRNSS
jgi:hypothetical protein